MDITPGIQEQLFNNGFTVIDNVYTSEEVSMLLQEIANADSSGPTFRKTGDLFAIRQLLKEVPSIHDLVFNNNLKAIIAKLPGDDYFIVKSIYFDKPGQSNWFVPWHQDLTISVDKRCDVEGFGPWTIKHHGFSVQPPTDILESNCTIRIHLDDTDENNGALRVIPKSHRKGIYRPETIDRAVEKETVCTVKKGGVMIMKPLLLHASNRTTNKKNRRVIHLEFSNRTLPRPLQWAEKENILT